MRILLILLLAGTLAHAQKVVNRGGGSSSGGEANWTDSSEMAAGLSDETGTGAAVMGTSPTIATPNLTGKIDTNNVSVDDDDCTGEQGKLWYDSTDSAFEFCNANSGTPSVLGGGGGGPSWTTRTIWFTQSMSESTNGDTVSSHITDTTAGTEPGSAGSVGTSGLSYLGVDAGDAFMIQGQLDPEWDDTNFELVFSSYVSSTETDAYDMEHVMECYTPGDDVTNAVNDISHTEFNAAGGTATASLLWQYTVDETDLSSIGSTCAPGDLFAITVEFLSSSTATNQLRMFSVQIKQGI